MVPLLITCVQFRPIKGQRDQNLDRVQSILDGAEADLIILPELFATGYYFDSTEQAQALSEPIPTGPTVVRLESWAVQTGATIVAGIAEQDGDQYYNSAVVVTPNGWLGTYRKTHLFNEETLHFSPGRSGFQVWDVPDRRGQIYRLGVMVCFDWLFPESARSLALNGADVIAHPSNLVLPHCPRAMPVRALENHVFTATANRIGTESNGRDSLTFIGQSVICGPDGTVLASAGADTTETISARFDPKVSRQRQINPYNDLLEDRKPDLYN